MRYALVPVRALAISIAACLLCIVASGLPELEPQGICALGVAAVIFWGERLNPLPWALAWWVGGFFGVAPHVAVALVAGFHAARHPLPARWTLGVASVGLVGMTMMLRPDNMLRPHPATADIVCLGDSSPAGVEVAEPYCSLLGGDNFAVPGASPTGTITQWRAARKLHPRVVTWQAGPNVKGAPDSALPEALSIIAREAAEDGVRLIVVEYPVTLWPEPKWRRQTREAIPSGVTLVDPRLPWWEINADHIHPTAAGHRRIARAVAEAIQAAERREARARGKKS